MQTAADILTQPFATLSDLIAAHARERGSKAAIIHGDRSLTYAQLDARMDAIAAALQRDGLGHGQAVAIVGAMGLDYAALFLGAIRAGGAPAPVAPSSTGDQMAAMIDRRPNRAIDTAPGRHRPCHVDAAPGHRRR